MIYAAYLPNFVTLALVIAEGQTRAPTMADWKHCALGGG